MVTHPQAFHGWFTAREACRRLGISQPTFSRLARAAGDQIVRRGRGRATEYAWVRELLGLGSRIPLHCVDMEGNSRRIAWLRPLDAGEWHVEPATEAPPFWLVNEAGGRDFPDLPWFLHDLRPSGYLGRLIAREVHARISAPADPRYWNGVHTVHWLAQFSHDVPGALLVGDLPLRETIERHLPCHAPADYADLAESLDRHVQPGSSAAGEQPKFLVRDPEGHPRLVKFSPAGEGPEVRRWQDLLVCEHLALEILAEAGVDAARSRLHEGGGRLFLELERFDRVGTRGRRLVFSLEALDAEFCGTGEWLSASECLLRRGWLDSSDFERIRTLHAFGRLIGNTDMHGGNLAFFVDADRLRLAPAYDMLPMAFAPTRGVVPDRLPDFRAIDAGDDARALAAAYARRIRRCERLDPAFRSVLAEGIERRLNPGRIA